MPSEPFYITLLRVLIVLAGGVLTFVATALVGVAVDVPVRVLGDWIADQFGVVGVYVALAALFAGGFAFTRWAIRRSDRQQVAETGILDYRRPNVVREGLGRNLAILLAPLALLVAVGFLLWLTGTPLPPASPR